ncbi:MAG TPA: PSD1 and planctomycete cytochrome C domain-containing protein [Planctomycetaceae bacterium]|nr:PSD1 and planctomycete cytochrome C domain-containing protein [Planctomycetaceae bacterium]
MLHIMKRNWSSSIIIILTLCLTTVAGADENYPEPTAEGIKFFEAKIRPVLVDQCYRCHSSDGQAVRGGLSVANRTALLVGGESGPAVVPGDLEQSLLWNAINYRDFSMPPKTKLPVETIADFRTWIEMGAPDPRVPTGVVLNSRVTEEDIQTGKEFWAFKPPVAPTIPQGSAWATTKIDRLVEQQFVAHELTPATDADAHTFLRRLHLDLAGLPPSPETMAQFTEAWKLNPEQAISSEVDRLLGTLQFGERWARHWLDVARYAESTGKEVDVSFPNAWRYRDYVIDAFNNDKPYDEFVREQVAGDLLPAKTDEEWAEHLIATGFLALGPKALIEQNPRQFQADLIDEQIDVTSRVFMGVSVACARCHDHKFDPIPQTDYYALAGIFQSTETFYGGVRSQRNRQPSNLIILPMDDPNPSDKAMTKQEIAELRQRRDELEKEAIEARRAQRMPQTKETDPRRTIANQFVLDAQAAQLTNRLNSVDENGKPLTVCMGVQAADRVKNAQVLVRGEIDQPAQEVPRGFVRVLSSNAAKIAPKSSGRLELAKWMTSPEHPLTARVMVNRIWQHLMGEAIVREPENFGASGPGPTDAALLDYLAVRFVESGWSVKTLVREIATSRVYRLSSQFDRQRFEKDPDNLYFARANTRRLDAEAIRDSMLTASGQLDTKRPRASMIAGFGSTLIGPNGPAMPGMMAMARSRQSGGNVFDSSVYYRSVYLPVARNLLPRSLEVFDFAEPSMVIGERESSNTPAQALYMMNNSFVLEQSDALARRILKEAEAPADRIELAFRLVYNRPPTKDEIQASNKFFRSADTTPTAGKGRAPRSANEQKFVALSEFCQALFASAEFRYVN